MRDILLSWKFEILLIPYLVARIFYGIFVSSQYNLFYDAYAEHAYWFRNQLLQGNIPISNPFSTGPRNRLLYPFISAIVGLFIPNIYTACALVNLFSNTVCLILFYYLINHLIGKKDVSFVSTIIFGLQFHMIMYTWAGMTDSTGIMFFLLSLIFIIKNYEHTTIFNSCLIVILLILTTLTRETFGIIAIAPLLNSIIALIEDYKRKYEISHYKEELTINFLILIISATISIAIFLFTNTFENILWLRNDLHVVLQINSDYNRELKNLLFILINMNINGSGLIGLLPGILEFSKTKKLCIFPILLILMALPNLLTSAAFMKRFFLISTMIIIFIEIYGVKVISEGRKNPTLVFWLISTGLIFITGFYYFQHYSIFSIDMPGLV